MNNLTFAHPALLWLLLLVPLTVVWYILRYRRQKPSLRYAPLSMLADSKPSLRQRLYPLLITLRCVALAAIVMALARPQSQLSRQEMKVEGIDIVLALDVSGSMQARDFKPDRLEAAKSVAKDFIEGRKSDRIGLVIFAGEAFTQVPLTIDHAVLQRQLAALKHGQLQDGTAIGDGLATAINRIKDSEAKSKVIILLTDGVNNMGSVDPTNASEIAALYGIRLYTIGIGTRGEAPFPVQDIFGHTHYQNMPVELDEPLLTQMAANTDGGTYYRATNKKALKDIFTQIDQLEKSKIDVTQYAQTRDEQGRFVWIALAALLLELLLGLLYFKS